MPKKAMSPVAVIACRQQDVHSFAKLKLTSSHFLGSALGRLRHVQAVRGTKINL